MHRNTCESTQIHTEFWRKFKYFSCVFRYSRFSDSFSRRRRHWQCVFSLLVSVFAFHKLPRNEAKKEKRETPPTTKTTAKCGIEPKEIVCFRLLRIGSWRVLAQLREVIKTSVSSTLVSFVIVCVPNTKHRQTKEERQQRGSAWNSKTINSDQWLEKIDSTLNSCTQTHTIRHKFLYVPWLVRVQDAKIKDLFLIWVLRLSLYLQWCVYICYVCLWIYVVHCTALCLQGIKSNRNKCHRHRRCINLILIRNLSNA